MNIEKEIKKIILEYYRRPQNYEDFKQLIYLLHEELIDNQELLIREVGVFKTRILGND